MTRKKISHNTLRFLYAKSGNNCAFPGCTMPIFEDDGLLTGECCHIEALSKGGARYNDATSEEEKNDESNLVLMCSRHHTIIDSDSVKYTPEFLKKIKHDHELQYSATHKVLNDNMLLALEQSMDRYWTKLQVIDSVDNHLKIKIDTSATIEQLLGYIQDNFTRVEELFDIMYRLDEKLPEDLKDLCERVGVDYQKFEKVPYYENHLIHRLWEYHCLGVPNVSAHLKMYFLQFCVKVFAELAKHSAEYNDILKECQDKLAAHQQCNYYAD